MKKGIIIPEQSIKKLLSGESALFVKSFEHPSKYYRSRGDQATRIEEQDDWYKDRNHCIREEGGGWQDFTKEEFLEYIKAPLKTENNIFIQEEFYESDEGPIFYKIDGCSRYLCYKNSSEMEYNQSRLRDFSLNVEVKRIIDIIDSHADLFYPKEFAEIKHHKYNFVLLYKVEKNIQ